MLDCLVAAVEEIQIQMLEVVVEVTCSIPLCLLLQEKLYQ